MVNVEKVCGSKERWRYGGGGCGGGGGGDDGDGDDGDGW